MDRTIASHIVSTEDRCGGRPRIAGTRIRVQDIVADHDHHGLSPEEIAREYPHITLAQVYAALAYYFDHRDEIRQQMKADEDFAANMQAKDDKQPRVGPGHKSADADTIPPG
ncbi:MAG: DUF433 domain-containing protein [Pirellulales bacterium]